MTTQPLPDWLEGITILPCSRCGVLCKLADTCTEDARLLKKATKPETSGFCPECAVAHFFQVVSPFGQIIAGNPAGKEMLLAPHVQQQFAGLMQSGNADLKSEEINWQRVHDNWELPFPSRKRGRKKA